MDALYLFWMLVFYDTRKHAFQCLYYILGCLFNLTLLDYVKVFLIQVTIDDLICLACLQSSGGCDSLLVFAKSACPEIVI